MILLVQSDFERLQRIWFYKLVNASLPPNPTGKSILNLYVSTLDRIINLDKFLIRQATKLAAEHDGCLEDDIINALEKAKEEGVTPWGRPATTATHVLESLVARMHYPTEASDRVQLDQQTPELLDFLYEWFKHQPEVQREEQPGGAPAIITEVLTQLGEPNVTLWTAYHSQDQARAFDQEVKFLLIDERGDFSAQPIRAVGKPGDPDVRNYSMEFAKDTKFDLERSDGTKLSINASRSDRVIATSPGYRFFNEQGYVNTNVIPDSIAHVLTPDAQQGPSYAGHIAQDYTYWIIGGLHYVSDQADEQTLESDLQQLQPSDVIIHVEIPRRDISLWFQGVLRHYVRSVGINIEDIEGLVKSLSGNDTKFTPPLESSSEFEEEYILRLAIWLACELDLERVYIHGLGLDYIVRREDHSANKMDSEMNQEVYADLLAKIVVANRARGVDVVSQIAEPFGLPARNLVAFIKVCFLRAFPVRSQEWITLEDLPAFKTILEQGWFKDTYEIQGQQINFRVAIVPVALFRLHPGYLKFVGAGDTTSAVSFVFGYQNIIGTQTRLAAVPA